MYCSYNLICDDNNVIYIYIFIVILMQKYFDFSIFSTVSTENKFYFSCITNSFSRNNVFFEGI